MCLYTFWPVSVLNLLSADTRRGVGSAGGLERGRVWEIGDGVESPELLDSRRKRKWAGFLKAERQEWRHMYACHGTCTCM